MPDAVRSALDSLLDSLPGCTVVVVPPAGEPQMFRLSKPKQSDTDCAEDILYVLGEVLNPLTTMELMKEMEKRGIIHGDSTIKYTLAEMVKKHEIINRSEKPRGYCLPQWRPA
jgi:hypothetical protein